MSSLSVGGKILYAWWKNRQSVAKGGLSWRNVLDADSRKICRAFNGLSVETEYSDPLFHLAISSGIRIAVDDFD